MSDGKQEVDLSQQFGPAGVGGINKLAKRSKADSAAPAQPAPPADAEDLDLFDEPTDLDVEESWDDNASESHRDDAFSVAVYLLPEVARKLTQVRRSTRKTNADLCLDAIDYWHRRGQLGRLVTQRQIGPRKRPKGSLFPDRRGTGRANTGQHRKLWSLQATLAEIEVIDRLVEELDANSRSELVSVALEARYGTKARKGTS